MGLLFKKDNGVKVNWYKFQAIDGSLPNFKEGMCVKVSLFSDHIEFDEVTLGKEKAKVSLGYDKVVDANKITEEEIKEKEKSVLGRAVVGGLVLGPLGAVVGGTSGVGTKKKKVIKSYFVINYKDKNDEIQAIPLEIYDLTGFNGFLKDLRKRCNLIELPKNLTVEL